MDQELGYMCRSFLLFRGALLNKDWINDWKNEIGKPLKLQGTTSTYKNFEYALELSKCTSYNTFLHTPVLFVYSIRNYTGFQGFRLSDKRYSVYPSEQEYLLVEGLVVYVLDVEEDF